MVIISNEIRVSDYSPKLAEYCRKNLVVRNPEYENRLRMNHWLGNTPEYLHLYKVNGNELILPYGCLDDVLAIEWSQNFRTEFHPDQKVDYKAKGINLYDYQVEAVDAMVVTGHGILQSPAGSGKTQMGIAITAELGRKTLWLTHTKDLLTQSKQRFEQYIDKSLMGTITEGRVKISEGITFATVQTMANLDLEQYKHCWDVVIVDECHRVAGTPTAMTMFYKVLNSLAAPHKFGLSATVHRADGLVNTTFAILGKVMHAVPDSAVADRVMKVGIVPVRTNTGISGDALNTDGTINYAKLINTLADDRERNAQIVSILESNSDQPSLILSDRLGHLESMMDLLPPHLAELAVMVSGKMSTKKEKLARTQAMEDMRSGKKRFLFATYALAKEGLDIPCLSRLYLTTPQTDYAVITQSIGRVARTAEGKVAPLVFDFIDKSGYFERAYKQRCTTYRKNGCYWEEMP